MKRMEIKLTTCHGDSVAIRKAVTAGFFYHVAAFSKEGHYKTLKHKQIVHIHPSSGMSYSDGFPARCVLYNELKGKDCIRNIIEIDPRWLLDIAPHYYKFIDMEEFEFPCIKMPKMKTQ